MLRHIYVTAWMIYNFVGSNIQLKVDLATSIFDAASFDDATYQHKHGGARVCALTSMASVCLRTRVLVGLPKPTATANHPRAETRCVQRNETMAPHRNADISGNEKLDDSSPVRMF